MESRFPVRFVDKRDPQYVALPRHVLVLQPPAHGASARDYLRVVEDVKGAIQERTLSNQVPHYAASGQELTVELLKRHVTDLMSNSSIEWLRGCVGFSIAYHPTKYQKLVAVLSRLPACGTLPSAPKLMSVPFEGELFAFKIQLHEDRFISPTSLRVWLDNPSDPVAEELIPSDSDNPFTFTDIYESKQKMEFFAIDSLVSDLLHESKIAPGDVDCKYEPLGNLFPDFELNLGGQEKSLGLNLAWCLMPDSRKNSETEGWRRLLRIA